MVVESGGVASNTSVGPLGEVDVFGTAIGTTLSGTKVFYFGPQLSQLVVESGGVASNTAISTDATEQVNAGGFDNSALIGGGTQYDYGSASGDTIYGGGFQIVESGGKAAARRSAAAAPEGAGRRLQVSRLCLGGGSVRINERSNDVRRRGQLVQQLQPLRS